MSKIKIDKVGGTHFVHIPDVGVGMYMGMDSGSAAFPEAASTTWETDPEIVAGKAVVPYGKDNNLPVEIRNIMEENNLAPGILEREKGLLFGQGPELYQKVYENGEVTRAWGQDKAIWDWLNSWDLMRYIDMAITEYKYLHGYFDKVFQTRAGRIGQGTKIAKLEVVPGVNARLGWVESRKLEDVREMFVGDFEEGCRKGITGYPVFDRNDPSRLRVR